MNQPEREWESSVRNLLEAICYGDIEPLSTLTIDKIDSLLATRESEIRGEELFKHLKEVERVLNLHSKPISAGGLDYVKAFEEMENYEKKLTIEYMGTLPNEKKV